MILLFRLALFGSISHALVSVPHRQPVQTLTVSTNEQLYLETSPLIGGPSWLPLHVTVVLAESNNVQHRYDFIPENPTDPTTLRKLLMFGSVPALVRHRTSTGKMQAPNIPVGVLPDFGFVLMDDEEDVVDSENSNKGNIDGGILEQQTPSKLTTTTATMFCARYPTQLNLIRNNCWTFAWELYDVLAEEQARQRRARQSKNDSSAEATNGEKF